MRLTTNAAKTVTSSNAPNAFGVGAVTSGTASAFSWNAKSGYRQDGVAPTGISTAYSFQKVGDRYYDPTLMCFLTRDTELDQLPYTYCGGDPVNCTDPDGHKQKWWQTLWNNVAAVGGSIGRILAGGFTALTMGLAGSKLLSGYNNMMINRQTLANESQMLQDYQTNHPDADMSRQWGVYQLQQKSSLKATGGFAAQAADQYYHGLGGAR